MNFCEVCNQIVFDGTHCNQPTTPVGLHDEVDGDE